MDDITCGKINGNNFNMLVVDVLGGKEGGRGYLYQSIVSVLQSFKDKEWKYVQVEPDTKNDKVDIMWEYEEGKQKVAQVKSSFNNFSKTDIIQWLEEITNDVSDADEISLILIGSLSDNTKRFINKLNNLKKIDQLKKEEIDDLEAIKNYLQKISVQQENFELTSLEAKINNSLDLFLTEQGHTVGYFTRAMMVDALINTFNKFSIQGKKVSRDEFEQNLLDWVYFNFPEVRGSDLLKKSLIVQLYLSKVLPFSKETNSLKPNFEKLRFFQDKKEKLIELIQQIDGIKLSKEKEPVMEERDQLFRNISSIMNVSGMGSGSYVSSEIPDIRKKGLIDRIKKLLNITLSESFFYVGNLQEQQVGIYYPFSEEATRGVKGSDIEKEKGELINSLLSKLDELEGICSYFRYLGEFQFIPLILKNEGLSYDEDIKVRVMFPKNVQVLRGDTITYPDIEVIEEFTGYKGILNNLIRHHKDSKVMENVNYTFRPLKQPILFNRKREEEDLKQEFRWYVNTLFGFDYFNDDDQFNVIVYEFKKLNANENISFPSFILVQANESFTIKYEITSKKLGRINKGELYYKL